MNLFELFIKIGLDDKASNAMKTTQRNSDALRNKINAMSIQFEKAEKDVKELSAKLAESAKKTGAASKETQELARQLDEAEKEAEQARKALESYNDELDETNSSTKSSSNNVSNFSNKLGVGLKAAATAATVAVSAATAAIASLTKQTINSFAEFEQLSGGAKKIFDQIDQAKIFKDAQNAYKELGLSANQYLAVINDVGATFAATMGDEAGYEAAKTGLKAISDYASGTGKNVDELSQKFTLITRSTSSYQSIADQFSGILPATTSAFLEQAQAAGLLDKSYESLTDVPIAEYQAAVAAMLERGVYALGLSGNTAMESATTISGSLAAMKASWSNLIVGLADDKADLSKLFDNFTESAVNAAKNVIPRVGASLGGISQVFKQLIVKAEEMLPQVASSLINPAISAAKGFISSIMSSAPKFIGIAFNDLIPFVLENIVDISEIIIKKLPVLIESIASVLPGFITVLIGSANKVVSVLISNLPNIIIKPIIKYLPSILDAIIAAGMKDLPNIVEGINNLIFALIPLIPQILNILIDSILLTFTSEWLVAFVKLIPVLLNGLGGLIVAICKALPSLLSAVVKLIFSPFIQLYTAIKAFFNNFSDYLVNFFADLGFNIVAGMLNGIKNSWKFLENGVEGLLSGFVDGVKNILDIHSPSGLFRDEIGKQMAAGVGVGWEKEFAKVKKGMEGSVSVTSDDFGIGGNYSGFEFSRNGYGYGASIGSVTINVDGAKYDDPHDLATIIAQEIQNMTERKAAVYA